MRSYREMARRLAELEAQQEPPAPDEAAMVAALSDDEVLNEAAWGLRGSALWLDGFAAFRSLITSVDRGAVYWQGIAARVNAVCDARGVVVCPLAQEEVIHARDLLASGVLKVHVDRQSHRPLEPCMDWHLNPPWQHPRSAELWTLGGQVERAFRCYALQTDALDDRTAPMDTDTLIAWLVMVEGAEHV